MASRTQRLIIGIVTMASVVVASLVAPSLVHAKVGHSHAASPSHEAPAAEAPCDHMKKAKPHCPGNDCKDALGCLAKCAQAGATVTSDEMPSFVVLANLAEPRPATPLGDRFVPPLLRPPIV
jgi:hypothetical protein